MMDLIRSPLQLVVKMTEQEWEDMMLRATKRDIRRARRRQAAQQKAAPVASVSSRRLGAIRAAQAADSSGVF